MSSLELALTPGEDVWACNDLAIFDGIGDWLDIVWSDRSFGVRVTAWGEVGVFNEENEDGVLIGNEDRGDEPKLIETRLAPQPASRSGLELASGVVWMTGKTVLEKDSD